MNKINNLLDELELQIANYSKLNQIISEGNVGWHIVHSCLVINSVCGAVIKSDATKFVKKFSFKAFLVLLLNSFPRGKAKAPSFTVPSEELSPASILQSIQTSRKSIEALAKAGKNQYFTHPIFGDLNTEQTIKFLGVHTNHHLKIIKDVLK
ncbi:MAG: DUF1569 domain-containing protein [Sediminibacterium sp.]|jgi:hypothetical protein|nr:MAG: DUF1569 domain-containing protein [Sediminibacterium sp.]